MIYMFREQVVDLSGKKSNQVFDELANWEEVLKGSSLANPTRACSRSARSSMTLSGSRGDSKVF